MPQPLSNVDRTQRDNKVLHFVKKGFGTVCDLEKELGLPKNAISTSLYRLVNDKRVQRLRNPRNHPQWMYAPGKHSSKRTTSPHRPVNQIGKKLLPA